MLLFTSIEVKFDQSFIYCDGFQKNTVCKYNIIPYLYFLSSRDCLNKIHINIDFFISLILFLPHY